MSDKKKKEQNQATPLEKQYGEMVKNASPKSRKIVNGLKAFLVGGFICAFAEGIKYCLLKTNLTEDEIKATIPITLIIITAALTGLGLFQKIAKHAGAGTFVPITGFANSVVSPAMEFQTEGRILGTGAKMFTIAGPVIAYGCGAAVLYGFIYYFFM